MTRFAAAVPLFAAALALAACEDRSSSSATEPERPRTAGAQPLILRVAYGSEKKSWLEEQVKAFAATAPKTTSGRPIRVETKAMGSGEAATAILTGTFKAHVFSPASAAYVSLLNQDWLSTAGHTKPIAAAGEPVVLSPIVIAMWRPMAGALGWPKKPIGWRDLLKVNANPKGWGAFGHPEWGGFKLGHTHPEFSNSGLLAVLAEAYAGARKTRGLDAADLDKKDTRAFVAQVESTLVHYGKSTGFFAEKMVARGPGYISAAVLYENLVIESYASQAAAAPFPLVAIYPQEGTFWSDHPWCVLDAEWVGAEEKDAAGKLLAFLKSKPAQERALALGFRPADPSIKIAAPVDAAHGVDPLQPQTLLEVPAAPALKKLLEVWAESKKGADLIFVFDKSGSMQGKPLEEARAGARTFLQQLNGRDEAALLFFDSKVYPVVGPVKMQEGREDLLKRIDFTVAGGGTALYDAVAAANQLAAERAAATPGRIHAVVVMTDGKDEDSKTPLSSLKAGLSSEHGGEVRIFTIAYGPDADARVLEQISEAARGATTRGTAENIVQVYQDVAAFF